MGIERSSILITGGAGSLGRALVKSALTFSPKVVRVVDNNECHLVELQRELGNTNIRYLVADIRDKNRLTQLLTGVDVVIHCAALKHVPVCEYNPSEAIRTNVDGSLNLVEAAIEKGVRKVIGISTDKAVHPINTYGATKLVMERLFADANTYAQTKFSCIRFGNFWGSSESVIEIWKKQVSEGKPVTVTEEDMSRYWINFDEAVEFTFECVDRMQGGEIFIPAMPLHTLHDLIGTVAPNCQTQIIGHRRGEKKREELYTEDEERYLTKEKGCMVVRLT